VTSRLEEVRAVSALLLPLHSATVLKPVRVAKTLPGHGRALPVVQVRFEYFAVPLFRFLFFLEAR
jgi:hypothetical protein